MRMVEQNGGKLRRPKKIIKKSRFVRIKKFLRGTSLLDVQIWMGEQKKIVMGTLTRTSSSLVPTLSSLPALKSPMTLCAHAGSTSMQFATSRHPPTSPMCAPGLDSSIRCHTPLLPMRAFCHFANYWNLAHPSSGIMTWTTCLKNLNQWSLMRLKRASAYLTNPNWPAWP